MIERLRHYRAFRWSAYSVAFVLMVAAALVSASDAAGRELRRNWRLFSAIVRGVENGYRKRP